MSQRHRTIDVNTRMFHENEVLGETVIERRLFIEIDSIWSFSESVEYDGWTDVFTYSGLTFTIDMPYETLLDLKYNTYE